MSVTIDGQKIKEKTEVKYLGVTIDKKLTFQSEVKNTGSFPFVPPPA